ncbi:MAG: TetR/AcrR family transcriptional regulator [Actinomycetota bacterium]
MARENLTRRGRARRDALVAHAVDVVAKQGIAGTKVTHIARAAGVRSTLLYWYFDDLYDLVRFAISDATRRLNAHLVAAVSGLGDPLEQLYVAVREATAFGATDPEMRIISTADAEHAFGGAYRDALERSTAALVAETTRLLDAGRRRGSVRRDLPLEDLAQCIRSLVHYNVTAYHRGTLHRDAARFAVTTANIALRGVAANPAAVDELASRLDARGYAS